MEELEAKIRELVAQKGGLPFEEGDSDDGADGEAE